MAKNTTDHLTDQASMHRSADGMQIDFNVPVAMDDGVLLRADIFRPTGRGQFPAILSYGPYAKGLAFQEAYPAQWIKMVRDHPEVLQGSTSKYQNWEVIDPERWIEHGYVCIRVDSRGTGRSPGRIDPWAPRETRDIYECIEWAASQAWSNGQIGMCGISYYAINAWHVAGLQPPHLKAVIAWEGAADFYRDMTYHGGIHSAFVDSWYSRQVAVVQYGIGERAGRNPNTGEPVSQPSNLSTDELSLNRVDLPAEVLRHPLDDPWHRERSAQWDKVKVPFLSCANWGGQGLHPRGNFEAFTEAAGPEKWLEVHGDSHWSLFYTQYGLDLQRRFFDRFLKGITTAWDPQPRVRLQVRHPGGFVARGEEGWPIPRTTWTRLYLNPTKMALQEEELPAEHLVSYEGLGEGVDFSIVVDDEIEITGPIAAKLFVSSSTRDADLFLVVRVFDPGGAELVFQGALDPNTPIAQGWLRASHRKLNDAKSQAHRPYHTHDEVQPLAPGQVVELDIEIWPTCIVVPAGWRITLTVRGKDYEYPGDLDEFARTFVYSSRGCGPFLHTSPHDRLEKVVGGQVTLHCGGERNSYLLLPIVPKG